MREIFTYGSVGGASGDRCFYPETNAGQLPALQTHAWRDHVERKAVPLRGGVNGYGLTPGA